MTAFHEIAAGSTFVVPADADDVVYTLHDDGAVSAENMEAMTAEQARDAFGAAELRVTSE